MSGAVTDCNSNKVDHDLLDASQWRDGYHPQLRHIFRESSYPSNQQIIDAVLAYAGVTGLRAFRTAFCPDFKGARNAQPPLLKKLVHKVHNDRRDCMFSNSPASPHRCARACGLGMYTHMVSSKIAIGTLMQMWPGRIDTNALLCKPVMLLLIAMSE